ncbi:restriction endonuclease [Brevibacillus reuszeri]|uniref:restriction endonuclease n=1 Tax=Brevibacillus reuszeri TaxID=54915 RepID=UPI00289A7716|nr:restriction endonuclease [Brevibacillus reuszeri]
MNIIYHYPPEVFNLLVDTIPLLFRSKNDVILFFRGAGVPSSFINDVETKVRVNRDSISKYEIVRIILTRINEAGEKTLRERREVLKRVVEFESFSSCWPNDQLKAKGLVTEIQKVVNVKDSFTRMNQERENEAAKNRIDYQEKIVKIQKQRAERDEIKREFNGLFTMQNPHKRGKALENVLNKLFNSYGMLVKESFTLNGNNGEGIIEQIDGVIEIDNRIFLVEMKWWDKPIGVGEVSHHLIRIFNRGHASGIFISASQFTEPAKTVCRDSLSKALVVLVNLVEISRILEQDGDLKEMLRTKIKAAIINRKPLYTE